ncbi:MAG: hypothetical protein A2X25_11965 [Chloroflexi bacterium GWB2_49_20]|nr:MAG: hypothetical protein A2X25_11965 [Chloroflexi bacterium GWB2_49_20]OGN77718.1 MAG: hypothetical protein A2X26_10235 [Chloroflexi bacterium GWC2_49_37]OGN86493.1 MAG: hypothetical protein A2X27_06390 [Chloroflexi bacterium GWD2_49_16]HBG74744.1 hypothetical protein [Anaerolineae bacterium]
MKSKTGWIVVIVLGLILLLVLPGIFMTGRSWIGGYGGMMGPGMMGGFGYMNPFGFLGMALMWLIPIGLLVLSVFGAVALINGLTNPGNSSTPLPTRTCSNCGKQAQSGWMTCPYCGKPLQ